jgi:hypothetical protein
MIQALERVDGLIRELSAYRKVLKDHIAAQKRQPGRDWNDKYVYDERKNAVKRVYRRP